MSLRTQPHYRQAVQTYRFLMNATNALMPNGSLHKLPTDVWAVSKSSRCCGESLVWSPADDAQVSGTAEL